MNTPTPVTLTIKDCITLATAELEAMRLPLRDEENAKHARAALALLDSLKRWAESAEKPEEADEPENTEQEG